MAETEIKAIKENVKALQESKDINLARQADAYLSGLKAGYDMAKAKEGK